MVPMTIPSVALNNGVLIPQLGFGTYKLPPTETKDLVLRAFEAGYRHVDTAQMYRNEREVGQAVAASGLPRSEVFVTTKLNNAFHAHDDALAAFDRSLEELGLDVVDLFLIHWPLPAVGLYPQAWAALEEIYASGRARAIGVSNFQPAHLERILETGSVVPAVNQIEVHPYLRQDEVRAFNTTHGIVTEAWSPLGRGTVLADPVIAVIASRHGVTPAQVVLRWHLQRGDVVFPKSATPARIAENADLFGFALDDGDLAAIDALHRDERTGSHPDTENRTGR
ncbi:2,5-didehydrogluconate reductase [Xylanimonas cellulosilytica DSM 15894]|uniref:2,5-didehydrogluconate reductase n=1 Tax=Xylanimonas cellulosilytica (strain DSM 15894 / JCM 12276 / CECT 5975 / KCTC 9989 / LMG 20990 / NBRC 107835 / XIL07) TaxID=446471 RepID=D1C0L1_XYLCX|nr:2,5-didehydrogluconate reductase [Xylanimonas cellulosilytica DSM 15894]